MSVTQKGWKRVKLIVNRIWSAAALSVALLALGACGSSLPGDAASATATAKAISTPSTGVTPSAPPATPGTARLNGCPSQQPPALATTKADVVITGTGGVDQKPTSAHKGQVVEIALSAVTRWSLREQGATQSLTPASPNGWFRSSPSGCVWRFTASATGTVILQFSGTPVCAPGTQCSNLARIEAFTVTVSG